MVSLMELLARAVSSVRHPSDAQREILDRLGVLRSRFEQDLLRVAVIGQFKRGKSTLINALLGASVLPTGVTPVTALPTFISAGDSARIRVEFKSGKNPIVASGAAEVGRLLELYVAETRNPQNRFVVKSVAIEVESRFLNEGIVLIDTPGVGSTFAHNTRVAEAALSECDAALFVLSPDPPITEIEANYLDKVRKLIPKVFYVLNKGDLLDEAEAETAELFLVDALVARRALAANEGIFALSAKQALRAKLQGDVAGFEESGLAHLERVLVDALAKEKRAILFETGRLRLLSLVSELLFQCELERQALLTPEAELKEKAEMFEASAVKFETERRRLSDLLSIDLKQMIRDLEAETDRVWKGARDELRQIVAEIIDWSAEEESARQRIGAALSRRFAGALDDSVSSLRDKLAKVLSVHQHRAGDLVDLVRRTAADLMHISANLPRAAEAFQPRREPYWLAPEPSVTLLDLSAVGAAHLLPRSLRERRARDRLLAEAERAALRNVANLDWALRQNIQDSFTRFEASLSGELGAALQATRQALQLARTRGAARSRDIEADVEEAARCTGELSSVLAKLQPSMCEPRSAGDDGGTRKC